MSWTSILLVFLGGGLGSVSRYLVAWLISQRFESVYSIGTLTVNIVGSLLLGLVVGGLSKYQLTNHHLSYLLAIGFCGGFTTFSTFSYENALLLKAGQYGPFALYAGGSLILGIGALMLGLLLTKWV
ncbi:fluoride efflux transporter CrcB [bacterium SCSIO 12741]|nr:fluoride efflux transporter CrcB [bacterium SCSIO 12741]